MSEGIEWSATTDPTHARTNVPDQGVDAAEAHADGPDPGCLDDALTPLWVTGFEGEYGARSIGLALVDVVVGVARESGVVHAEPVSSRSAVPPSPPRRQKLRNQHGVRLLLLHAHGQRLDPAQQ